MYTWIICLSRLLRWTRREVTRIALYLRRDWPDKIRQWQKRKLDQWHIFPCQGMLSCCASIIEPEYLLKINALGRPGGWKTLYHLHVVNRRSAFALLWDDETDVQAFRMVDKLRDCRPSSVATINRTYESGVRTMSSASVSAGNEGLYDVRPNPQKQQDTWKSKGFKRGRQGLLTDNSQVVYNAWGVRKTHCMIQWRARRSSMSSRTSSLQVSRLCRRFTVSLSC